MAKINSINNRSASLTIDPGVSGDSYVQLDINATGKFRVGVDDNDSDKFKISSGSALGTNDTFVMTSDGERTLPLNSSFLAYLGTNDSNVTGDGTAFTLGSGNALTEVFDQNNDFATSGTFTAPVTGKYLFCGGFNLGDLTASHDAGFERLLTSNRNYVGNLINWGAIRAVTVNANQAIFDYSFIADMDAADTATMTISVYGSTLTVDVIAADTNSFFSGCLIS